jgi:hypothetical protein
MEEIRANTVRLSGRRPVPALQVTGGTSRWQCTAMTGSCLPRVRQPRAGIWFSRHSHNDFFQASHGDFFQASHGDHLSPLLHKLVRQAMVDLAGYKARVERADVIEPYCVGCGHRDQKGDIDTHETVRRIMRDASLYEVLDDETMVALTDW